MKKRFLCALLALLMLTALIPTTALAEEDEIGTESLKLKEISGEDRLLVTETSAPYGMSFASVDDGELKLNNDHAEKWVDRVDDEKNYVHSFYKIIEEALDNDGLDDYLIDDNYFEYSSGPADWTKAEVGKLMKNSDNVCLVLGSTKSDKGWAPEQERSYVSKCMIAALNAIDRDHPEVFWLSGSYVYNYHGVKSGNDYVMYYYIILRRTDFDIRKDEYKNKSAIKSRIEKNNSKVNEILGGFESGWDTYQKVEYLNDWLTKNNCYNSLVAAGASTGVTKDAWECTSALDGRTGEEGPVCEGYARAFKVLCDRADIHCVLVDGAARSTAGSSGGAHMWNYVQMEDGKWYAVDTTWDDPTTGSDNAVSGRETDQWLLIGGNTYVGKNWKFIDSHPVENHVSTSGLYFTNGPVLNDTAYARLTYSGMPEAIQKGTTVTLTANRMPMRDQFSGVIYTYEAEGLPAGLSIDKMTGDISGTVGEEITADKVATVTLKENGAVAATCRLDFPTATGHVHVYDSTWESTEAGHCHTCTICGEKTKLESHTWRTEHDSTQHWDVCTVCGYASAKTAHTWDAGKVTREPSYDSAGEKTYTCTKCQATRTEAIPALEHKYSDTWSSDENNHWHQCTDPGYESLFTDKQPHTWDGGELTTPPECEKPGVRTYTCTVCGHKRTETVNALGHSYGSWKSDESSHWHECTVCGKPDTKAAHTWGEPVVTSAPSDGKPGVRTRTRTCTVCGYVKTETYFEDVLVEVELGSSEAAVAAGAKIPDGVSREDLTKAAQGVTSPDLTAKVSAEAAELIEKNSVTAASARKALGVGEGEEVTVVIDPYLSIQVKGYEISGGARALTLDITALYTIKAEAAGNETVLKSAQPLTFDGELNITVPLPTGFVEGEGTPVYVRHKGYEYTATLALTGGTYAASFTDPHGFSEFVITTASAAVAKIGGTVYTGLAAAVDAVENGGTIVILGSTEEKVKVSREVTFTVTDSKGLLAADAITAGTGYTMTKDAATGRYTFKLTPAPSGPSNPGPSDPGPSPSGPSAPSLPSIPSTPKSFKIDLTAPENGEVKVSATSAAAGEAVTVTVTAGGTYHVRGVDVSGDGLKVDVEDLGGGKYSFTMPSGDVTVTAKIVKCPSASFADIGAKSWYHDYADLVIESGLMSGVGDGRFDPSGTVTRAQMVMTLWNREGRPSVDYLMTFTDMAGEKWYTEAVRWAASTGIAQGYSDGTFRPGEEITRAQMAALLYRYEQYRGGITGESTGSLPFTDAGSIPGWASQAVAWCSENGVILGRTGGAFDPSGLAKRTELAAVLARLIGLGG